MKSRIVMLLVVVQVAIRTMANTATVNGIEWNYTVSDGEAEICNYIPSSWTGGIIFSPAISTSTTGAITIPSQLGGYPVRHISRSAFEGCSGLTSVTIPNGVTRIGILAFHGCSGLTSVTIPGSVTIIDASAFAGCSGLTSVTIPNGVRNIWDGAFSGCSGLTSVTIPNGVTIIGSSAFSGCSGLTSVAIPNSVNHIGKYAFKDCRNLKSIRIADGVGVDSSVFEGCNTAIFDTTTISGCKLVDGWVIEVGDTVSGDLVLDGVRGIGDGAFLGCSGITKVTIPNGVTRIGSSAFARCGGLTSVSIGNGVRTIDGSAFSSCTNLTRVTIPNSVTSIGAGVFSDCSGLEEITLPFVGSCRGNSGSVSSEFGYLFGYFEWLEGSALPTASPGMGTKQCYHQDYSTNALGGRYISYYHVPLSLKSVMITDETFLDNGAFFNCSTLTNVTIGGSVTSIGKRAFSYCYNLKSITMPNSVTSIGSAAFYSCRLKSVTIPNSVANIGTSAFEYCTALSSVTMGSGVTSIGEDAFFYCGGLEEVHITDLAKWCEISFDDNPLRYAGKLFLDGSLVSGDMTIPDGVKSIGNYAFYGCSGLTSVTIPDSVRRIGTSAFDGCSGLTSVTVPQCVCSRKSSSVFPAAYQSITNVVISSSVTSIGGGAFDGCYGLTSVTIPKSVTSIGVNAFSGCNQLREVRITDIAKWCEISFDDNPLCHAGNLFLNGSLVSGDMIIPDGVESIGNYAFYGCSGLTSVTIPDSVTSIGANAFSGCSGLTSATIPNSVTNIGSYAFSGCSGVTAFIVDAANVKYKSVAGLLLSKDGKTLIAGVNVRNLDIPDGVTNICSYAFFGCSKLAAVTIPTSVTNIGDWAFSGCSGLTSVTVPSSVTNIGDWAFSGCSGLTSVTVPSSVINIGSSAFSGCGGLEEITLPFVGACRGNTGSPWLFGYIFGTLPYADGIKTDQYYSSYSSTSPYSINPYCTSYYIPSKLKKVIISDDTVLGYGAFYNCSGLTSVTIPSSVTKIGDSAFSSCGGLTSITIPDGVTSIGAYAFSRCSGLASVTIPSSVTNICSGAFSQCHGLASVTIPDSVTSIGDYAFSQCYRLTGITIPPSVTLIGSSPFSNCSGLTSVIMAGNCPRRIVSSAFSGVSSSCVAYLPRDDDTYSVVDGKWYGMMVVYCDPVPVGPYTITFDANGGVGGTSVTLDYGAVLAAPTVTREGYTFKGWSPSVSTIVPAANVTYTAQWKANQYTVTFDANGGSVNESSRSVSFSCAVGTLPTPVRSGYTFDGWFTSSSGGAQVYASTVVSCAVTYYAHWTWTAEPIWTIDSAGVLTSVDLNDCKDIVIPESVTGIGKYVFRNCSGLASVKIPDSVTSIGAGAFSGCSGLEEITLPFVGACRGNTGSYDSLFGYIFGTSSYTGGTETKQRCSSSSSYSSYYIPSNLGRVVLTDETVLGYGAFSGCRGLTSVTIDNSVTNVESHAFYNCTNLASITIPDSVMSIGGGVFSGCSGLKSVTIGNSVTSIGASAFSDCHNLAGVYITDIAKWCWISFGDLTANPLYYAKNLFLNGLLVNGDLSIPAGVTSIGWGAFCGCSGLTSVTIPNSVTSIWAQAFSGCSGLKSVTIPDSVTSISSSAFSGCSGLEEINLPFVGARRGNTGRSDSLFGYIFGTSSYAGGTQTAQYHSNSGVSFYYIPSSLRKVVVTDETVLGYGAFYGCSGLTSVTIPASVTRIGYGAFCGCSGLTSVAMKGDCPTTDGSAFSGVNSFCAAYLPKENDTYSVVDGKWRGLIVVYCDLVPAGPYTMTFDANGGIGGISVTLDYGAVLAAPTVTRDGYTFAGWLPVVPATVPAANVTYTAKWQVNKYKVTFDANGGSVNESTRSVALGSAVGSLPTPTRTGCSFAGWWTSATGGTQISASTKITGAVTYYAHWTCAVTFNANGGSAIEASRMVAEGGPVGTLPTPTRSGYIFDGWFTAESGGMQISASTVISCAVTYYAHWTWTDQPILTIDPAGVLTGVDLNGYTDIVIPVGVTSIGSSAFKGCSGLTSVTIPNSVTSIGAGAFEGCSGLEEITLPFVGACRGDAGRDDSLFGYIFGRTSYTGSTKTWQQYSSSWYAYYIPSSLRRVVVTDETVLGYGAFSGCSGLTSVTIPDSVTSIGSYAFSGCSLSSITIPSSVEVISESAFSECGNLKSVTIKEGVSVIGDRAFAACSALKTINLPTSIMSIGDYAFGNSGLTSIAIPHGVGSIGFATFGNCLSLASVTVPGSVTSIEYDAFVYCSALKAVTYLGSCPDVSEGEIYYGTPTDLVSYVPAGDATWAEALAAGTWMDRAIKTGTAAKTYTVQFHKYDGSGATRDQVFKVGETKSLLWLESQLKWKREGYEFIGWVPWNPDSKARLCKYVNGQKVKDLAKEGETVHLWAAWKSQSSYRVCFNRNDGSGEKMNQVILRNKEDTLAWLDSQLEWTRPGYTFKGWAESATGAVKYANGAKVKNLAMNGGTKNLYAVWAGKQYKVQYHKYDGSGATLEQTFTMGKAQRLLWMDSQLHWMRDGYEFVGWVPWNPDSKARLCRYANGQEVKDIAVVDGKFTETVHLWCGWKSSSSYRVCFNKNDGSGAKLNQVILRNKEDTLAWLDSQICWTREGYTFQGWAETATGAVKYANGAKVKNLAMNGGTKNLYAVWKAVKKSVKMSAFFEPVEYVAFEEPGELPGMVVEGETADGGAFRLVVGEGGAAVLYLFDGEGWSEERCEVAAEGGVLAVAVDGGVAYRVTLAGVVPLLE